MTTFLRLLADKNKEHNLHASCTALRAGDTDSRIFQVEPESFRSVPGAPFAYWVSEVVRLAFKRLPSFESDERTARQGLATADDFRFVRTWWETHSASGGWLGFAKGGSYSPFYADVHLMGNWSCSGSEIRNFIDPKTGKVRSRPQNIEYFGRPGLTWPNATTLGMSTRALPSECIFGHMGPSGFLAGDDLAGLCSLIAIMNSRPFSILVEMQLALAAEGRKHYEVGVIQNTPVPNLSADQQATLAALARRAWSLKRTLDTIAETSHAFALPAALRIRSGNYDPPAIEPELSRIQVEIDAIAFDLYGFTEADRAAVHASQGAANEDDTGTNTDDEGDEEDSAAQIDQMAGLLSWAVGVAFGRFDWRLATDERAIPAEPEPFDPLPAKSPGMLPDGADPFHAHAGILVDDQGHTHDLARLVEEVLARVDVTVPDDVLRWLQRDFFAFHLQRYSKSRRKAPIYWPLSTTSGVYTLWVYYPSLTSQTLYTAINDFIEPKLKQVGADVTALRNKGSARTRDDEKQFEALQAFELELIELRDTLLKLAPTYKPNHDDGVQICAAPLWLLFRHKPWQNLLKDTWTKLGKGDYDWAHLAMTYWPERVREKCKTDKSLAIAHGLEDLYVEPEPKPKKPRGRRAKGV